MLVQPLQNACMLSLTSHQAVIAAQSDHKQSHCSFLFEDDAVFNLCARNVDFQSSKAETMNRVIAYGVSFVTSSMRADRISGIDFTDMQSNLVSYPCLHCTVISFAPTISKQEAGRTIFQAAELLDQCLVPIDKMLVCYTRKDKRPTAALMCHGDVASRDLTIAVVAIKARSVVTVVDWV